MRLRVEPDAGKPHCLRQEMGAGFNLSLTVIPPYRVLGLRDMR